MKKIRIGIAGYGNLGRGVELALAIVDTFLSTEFEGGRHQRRIDLLNA